MTTYPPPPPPPALYAPRKARPDIVTKWSIVTLVAGILAIIIGVVEIVAIQGTIAVVVGAIFIVLGVYILISGIGMLAGQKWALIMGGYTIMGWTKRPDVIEYFGLTPAYPSHPPGIPPTAPSPSAPTCPTCGQPLTYIQQYQRWYCQNCQKYA